jgi:hypothetical protein
LQKDLDIAADMKKKDMEQEWMKEGDKKISESKPTGSKRRGRPRMGWPEDVERELRDVKVERRRQKEFDREEWASVIKEAKAVRGL